MSGPKGSGFFLLQYFIISCIKTAQATDCMISETSRTACAGRSHLCPCLQLSLFLSAWPTQGLLSISKVNSVNFLEFLVVVSNLPIIFIMVLEKNRTEWNCMWMCMCCICDVCLYTYGKYVYLLLIYHISNIFMFQVSSCLCPILLKPRSSWKLRAAMYSRVGRISRIVWYHLLDQTDVFFFEEGSVGQLDLPVRPTKRTICLNYSNWY